MGNGFGDFVTSEQWNEMTPETRQYEIYRMLRCLDHRMCVLERHPWFDKCLAFMGGIFGGLAAALGMKWL